ncbi:MAG: response regulator [Deltaproteobacteria bacterium]|jgi:signal transduction histidine kinase/DNA-binding response OmpR family regulator|nr:response regulator [Deltaproteobacteria bacterium]
MTFLWKVFFISVGVLLFIIGCTMGTSLYFIHRGIKETILSDLKVISKIAEKLISSEIGLLKAQAWTAVNQVVGAPENKWVNVLESQVQSHESFLSITIFNSDGHVVAAYGEPLATASVLETPYAKLVAEGLTVISTTTTEPSGELVFYVFAPMDRGLIGVVTIPGLYFCRILARYRIWDSGTVFILDARGKVLANIRDYLVLGEYNAAEDFTDDINVNSSREFTLNMIKGQSGTGVYILENQKRLGYHTPISGSKTGWVLGVSAPLSESPLAYVDQAVILMSLVLMALGFLVAWLTSGFIDRQLSLINHQYQNLTELSQIARSASDAKTSFLASMSHEMRTPLNSIIGFAELMIYGRYNDDEKRDSLEKIHTAGLSLLGIVNDILDISKIESGRFELIEVEYDLSSLINDSVTVHLIRLGEKPIEFGLEIDKSLPGRLLGDELRIKQICGNILSNAFKYTEEGHVDMRVTGEVNGDVVWVTITVSDTGVGIKPEILPSLFTGYDQNNDPNVKSTTERSGLGLAITKKMVDMMGGRIEAKSDLGQGSTFTVIIPQRVATTIPLGAQTVENLENLNYYASRRIRQSNRAITPMPYARILIVDDVQANLDVAKGVLKPYQITIDCATSGQMSIDLVKENDGLYDAIFMDHMMPGMDGIEAARRIREDVGTDYAKKVPIIALTANAIMGSDKKFLESGFQDYLTKPIEIQRMEKVLRKWVRDPIKEAKLFPSEDNVSAAADEKMVVEGLDLDVARSRFGGDEEVLKSVLRSYADNMPELLNLLKFPAKDKIHDYAITAHGIKSSSYGVGAIEIGDMAKELELKAEEGDFDFILAHNWRFIDLVEKVVINIDGALGPGEAPVEKPKRSGPDPLILAKLRKACLAWDMDSVDAAIGELDKFAYQSSPEFMPWLREKVDRMAFDEIVEVISNEGALSSDQGEGEGETESHLTTLKEPDWALLSLLAKAAWDFDMDQVDSLMEELLAHNYENNGELVEWIQSKVNTMEFSAVHERLVGMYNTEVQPSTSGGDSKPLRGAPDPTVLERLRQACQKYDMDGVDSAIQELESYSYQEGEELTKWLKAKVIAFDFQEIYNRLSGETNA